MFSLIRLSQDFSEDEVLTKIAGIFPQLAFIFGLASIGFAPNGLIFTYEDAIVSLISGIFVFAILAIYLDLVIPNEFGSNRPYLFFLKCFNKKNQSEAHVSLLE